MIDEFDLDQDGESEFARAQSARVRTRCASTIFATPYVSLSFLLGCKNPEFTGVSLQSCTLVLVLCFIVDQNEFIAIMTGES